MKLLAHPFKNFPLFSATENVRTFTSKVPLSLRRVVAGMLRVAEKIFNVRPAFRARRLIDGNKIDQKIIWQM